MSARLKLYLAVAIFLVIGFNVAAGMAIAGASWGHEATMITALAVTGVFWIGCVTCGALIIGLHTRIGRQNTIVTVAAILTIIPVVGFISVIMLGLALATVNAAPSKDTSVMEPISSDLNKFPKPPVKQSGLEEVKSTKKRLERVERMLDDGAITREEYDILRQKILDESIT